MPPATSANETVFCEDFEDDYTSRWSSTIQGGTLATADGDGSKVLDVLFDAPPTDDLTGPRLRWPHVPTGSAVDVSFDFMLIEAFLKANGDGLLWFARIGASVGVGFGARLTPGSITYTAIVNAGGGDFSDEELTQFRFSPNEWTPVKLRYASTEEGADFSVRVASNPTYSASFKGDVDLLNNDDVFLGAFAKAGSATVRARFDNVVIRVMKR